MTLKTLPAIAAIMLVGCMMVGPDYHEPQKKIAPHWLQTGTLVKAAPIRDADWWQNFRDPTLSSLIYQGYQNNLSLQIAAVRILQSRAQLAKTVGELYPQQQAVSGNYTYQRIGGGSLQSVLPSSFLTAVMSFSASWELDFWGKYRRAIQANDALFLASIAAYDHALVTLIADIASAYINIRTQQALIHVTKTNIQVQTMSLGIAKSRFKAGQTSLLDVEQAQTELAETQATLPALISQMQRYQNSLGVLLGVTPNEIGQMLTKSRGIPKAAPNVAVSIPKETLAQRPDIYQARLEAVAQAANIGAIKANLLPALSLSGTFAFASNNINGNSLSELFNWANRTIVAGPSFSWPILNYGQITNAVRVQDAVFQQSLLNYLNLVLKAQSEVQDNITRYLAAQKSAYSLTIANQSAIKSTRLAIIRYKEGENDYTTVLDAERQQLRVQTSLTNAKGEIALSLVALYRSLGGGWQIRGCNDRVPAEIKIAMGQRTNWGNLLQQQNHQAPMTEWQQIKQLYLPTW